MPRAVENSMHLIHNIKQMNYNGTFPNFKLILLILLFFALLYGCVKELKPLPQADFTYTTTAECQLPMSVTFKNLSQNADIYRWDFGDGTPISHSDEPIHVYDTEGIYEVRLTAYGPGGTHETMLEVYVVTTPVSTFYTNDTVVNTGDSVYFYSSTNSTLPSTCLWSFGDGYTSTEINPVHVYSYPGTYTVVLTTTNACGASYVVHNNSILVSQIGAPPIPDFVANLTLINTGQSVSFTDLTQNNPNAWEWSFEGANPNISNIQNPTNVIYNTSGSFEVKLKAFNPFGSDSIIKTSYINVVPLGIAPIADFTANTTNITVGGNVNFTDLSINNPTSWQWQFQGGIPSTSTLQHPGNIVYNAAGSYHVSLTATNAQGSDIETKQYYINVSPSVITEVLIKKITVENMPFPTTPPFFRNPYYMITNSSNTVLRDGRGQYMQGIVHADMPIFWNLIPNFVINSPAFNVNFKIRLFDWRQNPSMDIFISEVLFNMSTYTIPPNAYPSSITLMQNNTKIILDLQWQ